MDETERKIKTEIRMLKEDLRVHKYGIQRQNQQALIDKPMRMPIPLKQNMHCNETTHYNDTDNEISTEATTPEDIGKYLYGKYARMATKKTKDKITPAKTTRVPLYVNDSRKYEKMLRKHGFVRDLTAIWWNKTQGIITIS